MLWLVCDQTAPKFLASTISAMSCAWAEKWEVEVAQQGLKAEMAEPDKLHAKLIFIWAEAIGGQHFPHIALGVT